MKTPCDIIRDLLPLYAEDMTSQASNELVEAHLGECESCTKYLEELKKPAKLPEEVPAQSLAHIKRKLRKAALILVAMILALVLVGIGGVSIFYNSMLNKISRVQLAGNHASEEIIQQSDVSPDETEDGIVNILVVGKSARSAGDAQTADTAVLLTINKNTKTVTLHSVLRDALVKYPAYRGESGGQCKFGEAYADAYEKWDVSGAMEVMNLLMEQNFGAKIDDNIEVDAEILPKLVDTVDGVEAELSEAEAAYLSKELAMTINPGRNTLDGTGAMAYAHMRLTDGSEKRAARQRYLADQILVKLGDMVQTGGVSAVKELCSELLPYVTTNMDNAQITKLMLEVISGWSQWKLENATIPAARTYKAELMDLTGSGRMEAVLTFDEAQNKKLVRAITEGEVTK